MPETKKGKKKTNAPVVPVAPPQATAAPPPPAPNAAPPPPAVPAGPDGRALPVLYPRVKASVFSTDSELGPLTIEDIVEILGWETESQCLARKCREFPNEDPKALAKKWAYGDDYHCKDVAGEKVRCTNNGGNRPFDEKWCERLRYTHLYGMWAGPHTIDDAVEGVYDPNGDPCEMLDGTVLQPGDPVRLVAGTVNGETIRISRYGRVMSGQHSLTAAKLADEQLHADRKQIGLDAANEKYPKWAKHNHVFVETIVVRGVSEDSRVLMTVDYVKPRSVADVFYTSKVFRGSGAAEREDLCKMLAVACDLLWTRTDARGYRTHPEMVAFLERHPRLLDCVNHIFQENRATVAGGQCYTCRGSGKTERGTCRSCGGRGKSLGGRKIGSLRVSPGHCAAIMYLMASNGPKTDGDEYRDPPAFGHPKDSVPCEKFIDFSYWSKAEDFWVDLAGGISMISVRRALSLLVDSTPGSDVNEGLGGRVTEKLALLAKAWAGYKDHPDAAGPPFVDDDMKKGGALHLDYGDLDERGNKLPDNQVVLLRGQDDFGGIDCPDAAAPGTRTATKPPDFVPTEAQVEAAKDDALQRRARAQAAIDQARENAKARRK